MTITLEQEKRELPAKLMALWERRKRHIALLHLLFQTEIGEEDMLRASYWISETKREAQNYWTKIFIYAAALVYLLFLCNILLAVVKVSKCSGQSNNGRTMGSWHTALLAALTQNHQTLSIAPFSSTTAVPLLIISMIHCFLERNKERNILRIQYFHDYLLF